MHTKNTWHITGDQSMLANFLVTQAGNILKFNKAAVGS